MLVQVNSDNHINAGEDTVAEIEADVRRRLDRYASRLTRVELHFRDVNADSNVGDDKLCTMEARPNGLDPLTVTASAATIGQASAGAAAKLLVALERTFGKLTSRKGH
ncbi:hypothetical protein [Polymorphobacter fuscus]|uniref:HPF/RaiA family ribosome-associated protein n=1 Tax=Sandarakinorhabdus fusca TaxID=1439888 RepID=A0A7C9GNQ5_9SPHN|nr:hypothetical protein [Polymorphobacter fuscus]KAB7647637.1 hypothetical protein F9290_06560 [Polymorphobacter fuscus]MQT16917.1 hypothetical protein [Polymorphobacter fuscus]NJC09093.1 hypothetical protein [Polymorphobacter fuscus]